MNILFASKPNADNFARPYTDHMGIPALVTADPNEVRAAETEVLWLEWANAWTASVVRTKHKAFTIVRIHDYEIWSGLIQNVDWNNVDLMWFINQQAMADFNEVIVTDTPQMFLPNAVSTEGIEVVCEDSKHIAMLSIDVSGRKRYDRAFMLMRLLPEYQLTIRANTHKGKIMGALTDRIHLDHRPFDASAIHDKSDVNEFFRGKSHILSTSEHEGFHVAVCEGCYAGLAPAVYNWEWGRARDFWDPNVADNLEDLADLIRRAGPSSGWRGWAGAKYSPEALAPRLMARIICAYPY